MPHVTFLSRAQLAALAVPTGSLVVSMVDPDQSPVLLDDSLQVDHRPFYFHDVSGEMEHLTPPDAVQAEPFSTRWSRTARLRGGSLSVEAGVGRSQACAAAAFDLLGEPLRAARIRRHGTYNRTLYALLRQAMGKPLPPDPLVSVVVRLKYPIDRFTALHQSLRRQRYTNWECVAVTDGEHYFAPMIQRMERVRLVQTARALGQWGHPHRQKGIDAASGQFIGLQNDDNYLVPGYLEQLVEVMEQDGTDLALCDQVHAYSGWSTVTTEAKAGSADLGCFLARRPLIQRVKWSGNDFLADGRFIEALRDQSRGISYVRRPLFVKN